MNYLTVMDVLDYVDEVKPNSYSRRVKLIWLRELEFRVQTDVMLLAAESTVTVPDDDTHELLVPLPWAEIYYDYLFMKLSEHLEESSEQNNRATTFEAAYKRFERWYARTYAPANGQAQFKGYYLKVLPVKGVDYFTQADIDEIVRRLSTPVINGTWDGTNITLTVDAQYASAFEQIKALYESGKRPILRIDGVDQLGVAGWTADFSWSKVDYSNGGAGTFIFSNVEYFDNQSYMRMSSIEVSASRIVYRYAEQTAS